MTAFSLSSLIQRLVIVVALLTLQAFPAKGRLPRGMQEDEPTGVARSSPRGRSKRESGLLRQRQLMAQDNGMPMEMGVNQNLYSQPQNNNVVYPHYYTQTQPQNNNAQDRFDSSTSPITVYEPFTCKPFSETVPNTGLSPYKNDPCVTNSCDTGCCRIMPGEYLYCDHTNQYWQYQCVCNMWTKSNPNVVVTNPNNQNSDTVTDPNSNINTNTNTNQNTKSPNTTTNTNPDTVTDPNSNVNTNTSTKQNSNQSTGSPNAGSGTNGDSLPWNVCRDGSVFHNPDMSTSAQLCWKASDCGASSTNANANAKNECCLKNFCLCGSPRDASTDCVPSGPST